jgi:hypothetical protein
MEHLPWCRPCKSQGVHWLRSEGGFCSEGAQRTDSAPVLRYARLRQALETRADTCRMRRPGTRHPTWYESAQQRQQALGGRGGGREATNAPQAQCQFAAASKRAAGDAAYVAQQKYAKSEAWVV